MKYRLAKIHWEDHVLNLRRISSNVWVRFLIFIPIAGVFVIWGIERYGNPLGGGVAAVVNNHAITVTEFQNAVQRRMEMYSKMFQGGVAMDKFQKFIKQEALMSLISSELVIQEGQELGLAASDGEVRKFITDIPILSKDGRFSKERYEQLLRAQRMTASQFEDQIRKQIVYEKMRDLFGSTVVASPLMVEKEKKLRSKMVSLEFLKLDKDQAEISVGDADAKAYADNKSHEGQIKEYYDLHKKDYVKEEEVRARHILIKATKGNSAEEKAGREKVQKILVELKSRKFEDVAKQYSEDPGSKIKGGDLDWFGRGKMVPEFEAAAFTMQIGSVSDAIQSPFGFHIIKLEGKRPAKTITLDEAKLGIARKLLVRSRIDSTLAEVNKQIAADPGAGLKKFETLVKAKKWDETGLFSLSDENIPKIGESEEIGAAVLGLKEKQNIVPRLVEIGGSVYALKLKKTEAAKPDQVEKASGDLSKELSQGSFIAWSQSLFEEARKNKRFTMNNRLIAADESGN